MFLTLWERIRGYDTWIETEARVTDSKVDKVSATVRSGATVNQYFSGAVLEYSDRNGEKQFDAFTVDDRSPLYQLVDGDVARIRYNPANPVEYYYPELLRTRVNSFVRRALIAFCFLAFTLFGIWTKFASARH